MYLWSVVWFIWFCGVFIMRSVLRFLVCGVFVGLFAWGFFVGLFLFGLFFFKSVGIVAVTDQLRYDLY